MKEKVEKHTYKGRHFTRKYWLYRDRDGNLMRIRIAHPPFLDFQEFNSFSNDVLLPLFAELKTKTIAVVNRRDFVEVLRLSDGGESQLDGFCT